jgi:serine/threonine protein kinase
LLYWDNQSCWEQGKILLNEYVVECLLGQGGMGAVYKVRRIQDNRIYAVKTLRVKRLKNIEHRLNFIEEIRTWIDLPKHPNITTCLFVRTIEDRLAIFSEYIDSGSLSHWINQGKIKDLGILLDIAIQFAWGLQAAHDQMVIHQDIKPGNTLMTRDGIAKLTDFGLARARYRVEVDDALNLTDRSVMVSSRGMTLAYCSPEQAEGLKLNRKTDMWSWGVSVLEMFIGKLTWMAGVYAPQILDMFRHQEPSIPGLEMTSDVYDVLYRCFERNPDDRWESMREIADILVDIYRKTTGKAYPRFMPIIDKNDSRQRNKPHGRVTVTGSNWDDPQIWLRRAYALTSKDISDARNFMSDSSSSQKAHLMSDLVVYEEAERHFVEYFKETDDEIHAGKDSERPDSGTSNPQVSIPEQFVELLINKAFVQRHISDLPGALATYDRAIEFLNSELFNKNQISTLLGLLRILEYKAVTSLFSTEYLYSRDTLDQAFPIAHRLIEQTQDTLYIYRLARLYKQKANVFWSEGRYNEAVSEFDSALQIWESIQSRIEIKPEMIWWLSSVYLNKAGALWKMNKLNEASIVSGKAMELLEDLVYCKDESYRLVELGNCCNNRGLIYSDLRDWSSADRMYHKALEIFQFLIQSNGMMEYQEDLARVFYNLGLLHQHQDNPSTAIEWFDMAISLNRKLIDTEGVTTLYFIVAEALMRKAISLIHITNYSQASVICGEAIEIFKNLMGKPENDSVKSCLAEAQLWNAVILYCSLEHVKAAALVQEWKPVFESCQTTTQQSHSIEVLHFLKTLNLA